MELDSFKSTAEFYSRFRVPYPKSLIAQLEVDANIGNTSVVLDLATGPGRLALRVAPSVRTVLAIDVEPEMLQEGADQARGLGIENVEWIQGRAEIFEVDSNSIDLVTIGEAIHRLDQDLVLNRIRHWLKNEGCVAIVGCFGVLYGARSWQKALRHAVKRWTIQGHRNDSRRWRGEYHDTARLIEAGFRGVLNRTFSISHRWTRDSILGNLHSTSRFSLPMLGNELQDFDNSVLTTLEAFDEDEFVQTIPCGYTIGWNED